MLLSLHGGVWFLFKGHVAIIYSCAVVCLVFVDTAMLDFICVNIGLEVIFN